MYLAILTHFGVLSVYVQRKRRPWYKVSRNLELARWLQGDSSVVSPNSRSRIKKPESLMMVENKMTKSLMPSSGIWTLLDSCYCHQQAKSNVSVVVAAIEPKQTNLNHPLWDHTIKVPNQRWYEQLLLECTSSTNTLKALVRIQIVWIRQMASRYQSRGMK